MEVYARDNTVQYVLGIRELRRRYTPMRFGTSNLAKCFDLLNLNKCCAIRYRVRTD